MISLGHWGCFPITLPTGYNRASISFTKWFWDNYIAWGD